MNAEEVARRYQFRDGMELVDYAEVGLPVFRLTIEAVTLVQKMIPTIQEFVLRGVGLGEGTVAGVAQFLGLSIDVVDAVVREANKVGWIGVKDVKADGEQSYQLSERGAEKIRETCQYEPQEEMLVIDYDGVRRKAVWLGNETVLRASDLGAFGALQIRPYPAAPPAISELSIPEVTRVVRRESGRQFSRDVLALKRIVRRHNVFREAIGLVYRNKKTKEVQIAFVVAGRPAEDYELEFARHGGPKKMGLVRAVEDGDHWARIRRRLGSQLYQLLTDEATLLKRRADVSAGREAVKMQAAKAETAFGPSRIKAREEFTAAQEQLAKAEHALELMDLRPLAPYEQPELLERAIRTAEREVLLSSSGIDSHIVSGFFLRLIDAAIERGVQIVVVSTFNPSQPPKRQRVGYDPLAELLSRHKQQRGLTLKRGSRDDALFYLVKDHDLAVVSNRFFLGERRRRANFFCVSGVVSSQPSIVSTIREALRLDN